MAGPLDWGAVAADQPQQEGPATWGAQPVEQPSRPAPQQSNLIDKLGPLALGVIGGPAGGELAYRMAKQTILGLPGQLEQLKSIETGQASPEQEGELAASTALSMISGGAAEQFGAARPALAKAIGPVIKDFQDTVIDPAIRKMAQDIHGQGTVGNAAEQALQRPIVETPMPSGANSSKDLNGPIYVDPRVPEELRRPVAIHETVEQSLMARGVPYQQAHIQATQAEKNFVESIGMNWEKYTHEWDGILDATEHEKPGTFPPDLHVNPEAAIGHHASENKKPGITAYHGSPYEFEKFDLSRIGTGEGAQSYGHGLYFAENPNVAESYRPFEIKNPGRSAEEVPSIDSGYMYQVNINANHEDFLDWDKPLSQQSPKVQSVLSELGIRGDQLPYQALENNPSMRRKQTAAEMSGIYPLGTNPSSVSPETTLREAGIAGIKYLDQGSRASGKGTYNYVVFDPNIVQVTHRNDIAMLQEAKDLGVIGEPRPEAQSEQSPAEMAFAAHPVSAAVTPEEMKSQLGHAPGSYDVRGAEWASKLDAPEDARAAVQELGQKYDWFGESRMGAPSAAARAAVAEAAGLDPAALNSEWLSKEFDSDAKVRAVIQALRQTTQDFMKAKDALRADPQSVEKASAMLEAEERHKNVLEYTMGARAESGRSLNAWKEALRETERSRASVKLKTEEDAGNVPAGIKDLVDAAGDVQRNIKNPEGATGLDKLIKAAGDLVDAQDKAPETRKKIEDVAKRARAAANESGEGKTPKGLADLLKEVEELAKEPGAPKGPGAPEAQGIASMVGEARRAAGTPNGARVLKKLAEQAERLAMTMPRTPEEAAARLPPDLAGVVTQARSVLTNLKQGGATKTALDKTVRQVDRQTRNILKEKAVRKPIEALPPELQDLVDKAERVVDRFGGIAKGEQAAFLLAKAGRTPAEQAEIARQVEGMTPNMVAGVLARLRKNSNPGWIFWTTQQSLISGLITHAKYFVVNLGQTFIDRVIVPEIAAIYGKLRGDDTSMLAPFHAAVEIFHAVPDALAGFKQAFKTGTRVPLESELRLAERGEPNPEAAGALIPYGQPGGPNWGVLQKAFSAEALNKAARVIGIPGRSAGGLHMFFKILNERAAAGARAFEAAQKDGLKPGSDEFWQRYQRHLDHPTDEALRQTIEDAYRGTFMEKLGTQTENFSRFIRNTPFKWLIFFTHLPFNMVRRSIEMSPLALLNTIGETRMGSAIKGELGHDAQNLAFAYMTVGTAVGAYFINQAMQGNATGDLPTDPVERKRWQELRIQPNSIKVGDFWVSTDRLGPAAMVGRIAANWASVMMHYDGNDESAFMKASLSVALGTAAVLSSDVGLESVKNIIDTLENPAQAARTAAWQLASLADPVTFAAQGASYLDPYMRRADTFTNALRYRTPIARETLLPKRDPLYGEPVPNPGYHAILRETPIVNDPIRTELDRLKIYAAYPQSRIGGVKLTEDQYDRYEATAGQLVKDLLQNYMDRSNYAATPDAVKTKDLRHLISLGRAEARKAMYPEYPEIIQQGVAQRKQAILGHQ